MNTEKYYTEQQKVNQNINDDNYNNIKTILLIALAIIFAYLIEKFFRNVFVNSIYFLIILLIVAFFIMSNFSNPYIDKIKYLFFKIFEYYPNNSYSDMDKINLEKVKDIYESGYMSNRMNKNYYSSNTQMLNRQNPNLNYNNINQSKNEDDLANKIFNINKINNGPLMNTFEKKYTNDGNSNEKNMNILENNNINNINNNYNYQIIGSKKYTNLPNSGSVNNENKQNNNFENNSKKDILSSPFKTKTRLPSSSNSTSENFFLFSQNNMNKISNKKIISDFNNINPLNRKSYNQYIPDFGNINNNIPIKRIPKNQEISYNKYQYLKNRYHNTQALNQDNNTIKYNREKIPRELANINYKNWIIKMKNFISRNLIPNIIIKHDENISNLNSILPSFGINIAPSLTDNEGDDYLSILKENIYFVNTNKIEINLDLNENKLNNILYKNAKNFIDNNYNFFNKDKNIGNNNISTFPSLMNFSNYFNDTKEIDKNKYNLEKQLKSVFFGDTNKIKRILGIIENKINTIEMQRNNESKSTSYYQKQKIIRTINSNNNPFLKSEDTQKIDNYIRNINDKNNATLTNLQRLLYERIIINERLYPKELFSKKDETHALLIIEYAIERFRQLQQDFDLYGNGSRGGDFLNESWCSLLPTDSQLISHLIVNYIETIYEISNYRNSQVFLLSYPSNYNILTKDKITNPKIQTSVFLYQINPPDIEPKFNIVYDGNLIPCLMKDINLFHAFAIYFYLLSSKSPMFVMDLGIYNFINELLK